MHDFITLKVILLIPHYKKILSYVVIANITFINAIKNIWHDNKCARKLFIITHELETISLLVLVFYFAELNSLCQ